MKKSDLLKQLSFWGLACIVGGLSSCTEQSVTITGKVKNAEGKVIVYYSTVDGIHNAMSKDTLHLQEDSTFLLTLTSTSPEKVNFILWGKHALGSVYAQPGLTEVEIDAAFADGIQFKKGLVAENKIIKELNTLDKEVFNLRARQGDAFDVSKDTVATSVYEKLIAYTQVLEKQLVGVDDAFRNRAIQDIRMQLLLAFENQFFATSYRASEATKKEWNEVFFKVIDYVDLNNPDNVSSSAFPEAIQNQLGILIYSINKPDKLPENTNERIKMYFDQYEASLQGRVQEVALANIFIEDYERETFATDIPELYERFKALHPQSSLMPYLDKAVEKNKHFNQTTLSEDIHIINSDSIRSFKEVTDLFPGKVIYIDVWATWCGPCRESFAYIKPLQQYAKEKDVVLLYVSIDRPEKAELWKKMTGYYDLKGEHVIINEFFKMDIYNTFGNNGSLSIPHYAIVNTKGELQFPSAANPKEVDKLIQQLEAAK